MGKTNENKRLRFAVMCNSTILQKWQQQVLERLLASGCAEPVLLIMPENGNQPEEKAWWRKIVTYPWNKLVFRKYYQYFFHPEAFARNAANFGNSELPVIRCAISLKNRYSEYFSREDIETIKSFQPDFILKFAFGIVRGDILHCATYGIWSFHHGDEQKYRGIPPAFHEIYHNDPVSASILQLLTETLDGGIILRKGFFPTISHSWRANLDQAIALSVGWPADVCREIIARQMLPSQSTLSSTKAPIYKEPGNLVTLHFLVRQFFNKIRFHLQELFLAENWSTGIVRCSAAEIIENNNYTIDDQMIEWLRAGNNDRYFADGFAIEKQQRLLLLFEDYSYRQQKGKISAAWFSENEQKFTGAITALEEPWHLSYPFVFKDGNDFFCIPESKQHGSVELYSLDFHNAKLVHLRTLLPGIAAADPTLVFHHNRWYLFFTPAHATNVELHIWHSESLSQPFVPHKQNPVKADIRNARPAGSFFRENDKLYRPAQDCSGTYGRRVVINEIIMLTAEIFLETPVSILKPPRGYNGIHTLSFAGGYMYFDCKKFVFSPASFIRQAKRRIKKGSGGQTVQ